MINYRGTPLFGEGSSVSHTSEFFAISGTVLFWLIFMIFAFVIKPQPEKPKYKEVQIVLSSTPVVQKTEESPAPAEQAAASASSSEPVVEKTVEPPAPKAEPVQKTETPAPKAPAKPAVKKEPAKTQTQPKKQQTPSSKTVPAEPENYAFDMSSGVNFNNVTKPKPTISEEDFDNFFKDDGNESDTPEKKSKIVEGKSSISDKSAGTAAEKPSESITSQNSSGASKNNDVSDSTSDALKGIKNTFQGNAQDGIQSQTNVKSRKSGSGKVEMEMSNGRSRALISPASPVINLSAQAAATIDTSKTVTINFKVLEAGNVTEIKITPESILTSIVRDEIKAQISKWLFEAADYTASANFEYKIIKR